MSRYLLDTHTWLWAIEDARELSPKVRRIILDPVNECYLSVASVWEIAVKISTGKLTFTFPDDLDVFVTRTNQSAGIGTLPISVSEACGVHKLPLHHRDPFDRLLLSQAASNDLVILSKDKKMKRYGLKVVW